MERLTVQEIYDFWLKKSNDHRYLRHRRWGEIASAINKFKVKTVLEFGSGISSLLFDNLDLKVVSLETDQEYMEFVRGMCSDNVTFILWDNKHLPKLPQSFDFSLVDGALPRTLQLETAIARADVVAIDDCVGRTKQTVLERMKDFERLDSDKTFMTVFKVS